jgi:3-deoxy-D-manno-octulosonate 8-phosphate phosphatase KdsC-like HAD superfamily phosphatase
MGLEGKTATGLHGADLHGANLIEKIRKVKVLILDVDGVLTDGRIIISDDGQETKSFNVRDGHGLKLIQRAGIEVILLTGRKSGLWSTVPANSA